MDNARQLTPGIDIVVVLGPTATGKTALAIRIALAFDGEVVNADSRYLYRGMDVGTAKPTAEERAGVPHYLIDIRDPHEPYSLATFLDDAYAAIEDIARRGRLPIVAGGTPQYLRALLEGWQVPHVAPDEQLRAELELEDTAALYARLQRIDPQSASRTGSANKRRIIRALEVYATTGRPMSEIAGKQAPPYRFRVIGLYQPRELLYPRIDARVAAMYAGGWLEEVRRLHERGVHAGIPAMSAHGYREALEVVLGQTDEADAIRRACAMIRRYVRHQQTWFRRFPGITWFDSSQPGYEDVAVDLVRQFLALP
jgi:tRNA dimethylallyltransferase